LRYIQNKKERKERKDPRDACVDVRRADVQSSHDTVEYDHKHRPADIAKTRHKSCSHQPPRLPKKKKKKKKKKKLRDVKRQTMIPCWGC
jgi:hypothetical protein